MQPNRRDLLALASGGVLARWLSGCDRLVVLDAENVTLIEPVTSNDDHYIYGVYPVPDVDPQSHRTRILDGEVELASFDLAFLQTLPARDKEHTLQCIGAGPGNIAISNSIWTGLPLVEVLSALGVEVPGDAVGLRMSGADKNDYTGEHYHAGVPLSSLTDPPIWIVWQMNGEPVPLVHGGPYRLLVPGRYGIKNVKWPIELAFVEVPHVSFWTERGWDEQALYKPNALVIFPPDQLQVPADQRLRFAGAAFAGDDPVVSVEISLDGGPFEPATLDYAPGADIWALWSWDARLEAGEHTLAARCTTRSGASSHPSPEGSNPWHGYDGSMQVTVIAG